MPSRLPALALALALAMAGLAIPARATTVVPMETRALVARSHEIVIGEVTAVTPRWNESRTRIVTDVRVRVTEALKGEAGPELVLTQVGGEVDGFRYTVDGAPSFRPGEEALLFAWRDRAGLAQVTGLAQGKFDIRRDPATGERTLRRALPGLVSRDPLLARAAPGGGRQALKLDDMVREIRRVLAEGAGR